MADEADMAWLRLSHSPHESNVDLEPTRSREPKVMGKTKPELDQGLPVDRPPKHESCWVDNDDPPEEVQAPGQELEDLNLNARST